MIHIAIFTDVLMIVPIISLAIMIDRERLSLLLVASVLPLRQIIQRRHRHRRIVLIKVLLQAHRLSHSLSHRAIIRVNSEWIITAPFRKLRALPRTHR